MRTVTAVLAACLACSFCAASDAAVYAFGSASQALETGSQRASISPSNARLYLAHRLGLSNYHNLEEADETTIGLLNHGARAQASLFGSIEDEAKVRRTLIVIEGVEKPDDFFGATHEPSFYISDPPSAAVNVQLVKDLLEQDRYKRGSQAWCGSDIPKENMDSEIQGGFSSDDPLGVCMIESLENASWGALSEHVKLEMLTASTTKIMQRFYKKNVPLYHVDDMVGVFHISTLRKLAIEGGTGSIKYQNALAGLQTILADQQAMEHVETTIVLMPVLRKVTKRCPEANPYGTYTKPSQLHSKRESISYSARSAGAASSPNKRQAETIIPKTTIPTCYNSNTTCQRATNNCSGHGACFKKYTDKALDDEEVPTCWSCGCVPTVLKQDDGTTKTVYWGGPACQKKDVSVPFFLFAGFGIAIMVALSTAMGMLYSVGQDDLPSVLGAGVAAAGVRK